MTNARPLHAIHDLVQTVTHVHNGLRYRIETVGNGALVTAQSSDEIVGQARLWVGPQKGENEFGGIFGRRPFKSRSGVHAVFHSLEVSPRFHRQGVGTHLTDLREQLAIARGATHAFAQIEATNTASLGNLIKQGFRPIARRRYKDDNVTYLLMHKPLQPTPA